MRVLLIGGAGAVGSAVSPHLVATHTVGVLDRSPPDAGLDVEFVHGDARSPDDVKAATSGCDVVVHMAAVVPREQERENEERVSEAFAVNVSSVHLALRAAIREQVPSFIHISSMAVYSRFGLEQVDLASPPDAREPYGLTKRLAEVVCQSQDDAAGLSVCSLRLAFPPPDADWPLWRPPGGGRRPCALALRDGTPLHPVAVSDVARGLNAAFAHRGTYRAYCILGDDDGRAVRGDDTATSLGWRPSRNR